MGENKFCSRLTLWTQAMVPRMAYMKTCVWKVCMCCPTFKFCHAGMDSRLDNWPDKHPRLQRSFIIIFFLFIWIKNPPHTETMTYKAWWALVEVKVSKPQTRSSPLCLHNFSGLEHTNTSFHTHIGFEQILLSWHSDFSRVFPLINGAMPGPTVAGLPLTHFSKWKIGLLSTSSPPSAH